MYKYYLQAEAVNINNFVYDTYNISTIRGGSFLLLDAIQSIPDAMPDLHPIATAASLGLFWFQAEEAEEKAVVANVFQHLQERTGGYATFSIATQRDTGDFNKTLELLVAKIRYQQWQTPTVVVPAPAKTSDECYLDGWRPGVEPYQLVSGAKISAATKYRRVRGVGFRKRFAANILGSSSLPEIQFTDDLSELALDNAKGVLNGKIAFFHVDGNKFGHIRRTYCHSESDRSKFDEIFQDKFRKEKFLKPLLTRAINDPDFCVQDANGNPVLRMEVLLWGGDEMTIVVPAWKGWEVVQAFYEAASALEFDGIPLTQRGALIFCHHNAPILLIRQIADNVLDRTKLDIHQTGRPLSHDVGDALHYLVLESFDLLQSDIDDFVRAYYTGYDYAKLLMYASELKNTLQDINTIRTTTTLGQVLDVVNTLSTQETDATPAKVERLISLCPRESRNSLQNAMENLTRQGSAPERWYLVSDLWDYVPKGVYS